MSSAALFLGSETGESAYRAAMGRVTDAVLSSFADEPDPYSGLSPAALADQFAEPVLPETGTGLAAAIDEVEDRVLAHSVGTSNPQCVAHLQCPPLIPGLAAEAMVAATNQSLDSFDQAPAATVIEERVVAADGEQLFRAVAPARGVEPRADTAGEDDGDERSIRGRV